MDLTLREEYWIKYCMKLIAVISPIIIKISVFAVPLNWYNTRLIPLIRQFFLIPNGINEFMDLRPYCFASLLNQFCQNLITTWL
jgi:membrane protein DedA with SNARE-associated domain